MRVPSGSSDRIMYFVAVDASDLYTRETGLTGFAVYRSRNGGAATAWATPTTSELSSSNMPGVYGLTIDEDTTIGSTHDTEEMCLHITHASMAPVTVVIELYRPKATEGETVTVASGNARSDVRQLLGTAWLTPGTAGTPDVNVKLWNALATVDLPLAPVTAGRKLVVDAAGLADANVVKLGPTGSGTAQTARDIGASVLLSSGTGTGQLDFTSGVVKANAVQLLGTAWAAPATAGYPDANVGKWLNTVVSTPTVAGVPNVNVKTFDTDAISADAVSAGAVAELQNGLALQTTLLAVAGYIDTEVSAIKAVTDTLSLAAIADAIWDELRAGHSLAGSYGESFYVIHAGQVTGAATLTTLVDSSLTQADANAWNGRTIIFIDGELKGQATNITGFVPGTDTLSFTALTRAPTAGPGGSRYIIV